MGLLRFSKTGNKSSESGIGEPAWNILFQDTLTQTALTGNDQDSSFSKIIALFNKIIQRLIGFMLSETVQIKAAIYRNFSFGYVVSIILSMSSLSALG